METTDETYGPIIGTRVRWWVRWDSETSIYLAGQASNCRYPKENPWEQDHGTVRCSQTGGGWTDKVGFAEGSVIGATQEYAVISVNHRLISIPWRYLWTEK